MDFEGFREIGCLIFAAKTTNQPISIQILEWDNSRFGVQKCANVFPEIANFLLLLLAQYPRY
jgi:hypothetical protein